MLSRALAATIGARAAAVMLATGILAAAEAEAHHHETPWPFQSASVSLDQPSGPGTTRPGEVIVRVGHDGAKYTQPVGDVSMRFRLRAKVGHPHYILLARVLTLDDPDLLASPNPALRALAESTSALGGHTLGRSMNRNVTLTLPAALAIDTGTGGIHLGSSPSQQVVDRCNTAFKEPPPTDQTAGQIEITVHAAFNAGNGWRRAGIGIGRRAIAFTTVPIQIVCLSSTAPRVGELQPTPLNVAIEVEPKGKSCPKETKVVAIADFAEKATVRLGVGSETHTSFKTVDTREVTLFGKTWHRAEYTTTSYLDPGKHKFRAEVENGPRSDWKAVDIDCPPFEITSAWLKYDVEDSLTCPTRVTETATFHATRPGKLDYHIKQQSGLVMHTGQAEVIRLGLQYKGVATRNFLLGAFDAELMAEVKKSSANSGWVQLKVDCREVLWANIDLRDPNGSACPRQAEAAITIKTNMAGLMPYSLECTGDRKWQKVATAHQTAPDTFIAVDTLPFEIEHEAQVSCVLKSLLDPTRKSIALRSRHYGCFKRSIAPPAGGLVADPTPPPGVVVDPPRPVCAGGRIVKTSTRPARYACRCPSGQTAQATGPNRFRCEGKSPTSISCAGGTARGSECICPSSMKRMQAGPNAWRCVRAAQKRPRLPAGRRK